MTKAGFGEHLKREREMRGVSLDEICAATRISNRFLEALENEDWDRLPGGVFNRGFVRAVARFLGLDEEGLVAEYALAMNECGAGPNLASQPAQPQTKARWLPWAALAALLALACLGWLSWHWYAARQAQRDARAAEIVTTPPAAVAAPGLPAPPSPEGTAGAAPAVPINGLQLKIEAGKAADLTVSGDGIPIFQGHMIAGQNRTFNAQMSFEVSAQDAGALLLELNGRTLAPMGPPGQPGTVTLTRRDIPAGAGGPD